MSTAAPPNARAFERIEGIVQTHLAETGIAGAALAVTRAGTVLSTSCFGLADVEKKTPVTAETPFAIGACAMTYTAVGILKLQDQGKLEVNAPLRTYRSFPSGSRAHGFGKVPLARFLSMSGGLPDKGPGEAPWEDGLDHTLSQGPRYVPGARNLFSHPSYWLLGSLIETVAEEPWADWMTREVIGKDGFDLPETTVLNGKGPKGMAVGYRYLPISEQFKAAEAVDAKGMFASSAIAASIQGLAQYMVRLDEQAVLSERGNRTLFHRVPLRSGRPGTWALGWEIRDPENTAGRWGIHGDVPGYDSTLLRAPRSQFSIALVANTADAGLEPLALRILRILERGR